ncbi:hypothetical protein [Verrucomicrobium sp. BvORR034]|jgi:hypothetical protein|uniref:hypothetical protein n=1 Tax=Verrucomicrobium sp. BvORR034 TaxID=1396418 RepID=UPI000678D231|nr:hypothetical protein [Verrucomicrobium sp. BvORR034]
MKRYTLGICGGVSVENPTERDIREAVFALDSREGDAFLILDQLEDGTFLQASGDRDVGFELAHQDSTSQQFRAKRDFSAGEIVRKFTSFSQGNPDWKNGMEWEFLGKAEMA